MTFIRDCYKIVAFLKGLKSCQFYRSGTSFDFEAVLTKTMAL